MIASAITAIITNNSVVSSSKKNLDVAKKSVVELPANPVKRMPLPMFFHNWFVFVPHPTQDSRVGFLIQKITIEATKIIKGGAKACPLGPISLKSNVDKQSSSTIP